MNTLKTMSLMIGLTLILVWAGAALGGKSGMTMALVFALLMMLAFLVDQIQLLACHLFQAVLEKEGAQVKILDMFAKNLDCSRLYIKPGVRC